MCTLNNNLGNQGDIITGVGGDVITGVGGDVIQVNVGGDFIQVNVGGDFIQVVGDGVTCAMARFVILKAKYNGECLRLTENNAALPAGFVKFEAREVVSLPAKFELETAQTGNGLVHIRCCYNNKYLVRSGISHWIVAAADRPEENKSKITCTLFKPEPVNNNSRGLQFRFRHIQLGTYACFWRAEFPFYGGLYAGSNESDKDECDVHTVVDYSVIDSVTYVKKEIWLPRFVVLKAKYKSKCLKLTKNDGALPAGFIKFEGDEVVSPQAMFELEMAKFELETAQIGNGLVHIRCCYNNKYLVRYTGALGTNCSSRWIVAAADKPEEDKSKISCTLFKLEPVNIERLEFRFRQIQLDLHACLWTCSMPAHIQNFGGLHGGSGAPDKDVFNVYKVVAWESLVRKINKAVLPSFVALQAIYESKFDLLHLVRARYVQRKRRIRILSSPRPAGNVRMSLPRPTGNVRMSLPRPTGNVRMPTPRPTGNVRMPTPHPTGNVPMLVESLYSILWKFKCTR